MKNLKKIIEERKNSERYGDSNEVDYDLINNDVKEAILKDSENLWKLVGQLSGLRLMHNDIPVEAMCQINELSAEYLRKKREIFGDFEDEQ